MRLVSFLTGTSIHEQEPLFLNPEHVVSVMCDDTGDGTDILTVTGQIYRVFDTISAVVLSLTESST